MGSSITGKPAEGMHLGKSDSVTCSDIMVRNLRQLYSAGLPLQLLSLSVNVVLPVSGHRMQEGTVVIYSATDFCFYWA